MGLPARGTRDATTGLSGGAGTDEEEKLVGWRSYCHHRCGDCCGHAAVKSGWRGVSRGCLWARKMPGERGQKNNGHASGCPLLMPHVPSSCFPARPAGLATWFTRLRFVDIEGLCFAPCLVMIMQGYRYLENVDNRRLWTIGGRCQCSPRCDYPGSPWATRWFPTPRRTALMTFHNGAEAVRKPLPDYRGIRKHALRSFAATLVGYRRGSRHMTTRKGRGRTRSTVRRPEVYTQTAIGEA